MLIQLDFTATNQINITFFSHLWVGSTLCAPRFVDLNFVCDLRVICTYFVTGFASVNLKALGWTLYAVALGLSMLWIANGLLCTTSSFQIIPIAFFANLTISVSVPQFQPPAAPSKPGRLRTPLFSRLWGHAVTEFIVHTFHVGPFIVALIPLVAVSWPAGPAISITIFALYQIHIPTEFTGSWESVAFKRGCRRLFAPVSLAHPWKSTYPDLPPHGRVTFACHPHGVLPVSWAMNFATFCPSNPFILMADVAFRVPVTREMALLYGCVNASMRTVENAFANNRNIMVLPGGVREMGYSAKGNQMTFVRRKGFIRAALKHKGSYIVPVVGFGIDSLYGHLTLRHEGLRRLFGVYLFAPIGRFDPWSPKLVHVCHVSGTPIPVPTTSEISEVLVESLFVAFYSEVQRVVDEHSVTCEHHRGVRVVFMEGHKQE
eukprot:c8352_g1_i1.p1 GENE.c8352_g1_i1~~c8352_g1_i1.p1  ORF type:complete len:432 (-),score=83.60 c8352_g1_i1:53-1348(-)